MVVYPIYHVYDFGWKEDMVAIMDKEAGAQSVVDELGVFNENKDFSGYCFHAQTIITSPEEVIEQLKLIGKV